MTIWRWLISRSKILQKRLSPQPKPSDWPRPPAMQPSSPKTSNSSNFAAASNRRRSNQIIRKAPRRPHSSSQPLFPASILFHEQRERRRVTVQEIPFTHRPDFAVAEEAGHADRAQTILNHFSVVVGRAKQVATATIATT